MSDDWASYCLQENQSATTPSQALNGPVTNENKINGVTPTEPVSSLTRLKKAAINSRIKELESRLAKERDVIPGMITTGTVTLVYAPSGAGKTVWILGNLFQSIRNNLIRGSDVIYFNEDDGAKGVLQGEAG